MKAEQVLLRAAVAAALVAIASMALGDPSPKRPPTPGVVIQDTGRSQLDPAAPPTIRD
jgi:hypothetical protein